MVGGAQAQTKQCLCKLCAFGICMSTCLWVLCVPCLSHRNRESMPCTDLEVVALRAAVARVACRSLPDEVFATLHGRGFGDSDE